jgi:hypothetical protein
MLATLSVSSPLSYLPPYTQVMPTAQVIFLSCVYVIWVDIMKTFATDLLHIQIYIDFTVSDTNM